MHAVLCCAVLVRKAPNLKRTLNLYLKDMQQDVRLTLALVPVCPIEHVYDIVHVCRFLAH